MPVSQALLKRVRKLLDPDDELRFVIPAVVVHSDRPDTLVVVSRTAITVYSTGFRKAPKDVITTAPRDTRLGPVHTAAGIPCFTLGGVLYEIDDEYVAVVNSADAELGPESSPPGPLSGL